MQVGRRLDEQGYPNGQARDHHHGGGGPVAPWPRGGDQVAGQHAGGGGSRPFDQVRAAFYYVRHDLTLRPADLLGEAGLAALIENVPPGG